MSFLERERRRVEAEEQARQSLLSAEERRQEAIRLANEEAARRQAPILEAAEARRNRARELLALSGVREIAGRLQEITGKSMLIKENIYSEYEDYISVMRATNHEPRRRFPLKGTIWGTARELNFIKDEDRIQVMSHESAALAVRWGGMSEGGPFAMIVEASPTGVLAFHARKDHMISGWERNPALVENAFGLAYDEPIVLGDFQYGFTSGNITEGPSDYGL